MSGFSLPDSNDLGQWQRDGFMGPFQAIAADVIGACQSDFAREFAQVDSQRTMNRHCDLPTVARLCRESTVWERLEPILGVDLVLWRSNLFLGNPQLDWHEDRHARLLGDGFTVSALMAMIDGGTDNCTLLVPGSHRLATKEKEQRYGIRADPQAGGNIRYLGQVAPEHYVRMSLAAGQCFIFHPQLLHASSGMLRGDAPAKARSSIVFRVTNPAVVVEPAAFESAPDITGPVLIRGVDRFGSNRYVELA